MGKENKKLMIWACLDEVEAMCRLASKPMTRKLWLQGQRFYNTMIRELVRLKYRGKVKRYPRHVLKRVIKKEPENVGVKR